MLKEDMKVLHQVGEDVTEIVQNSRRLRNSIFTWGGNTGNLIELLDMVDKQTECIDRLTTLVSSMRINR
jgi:hypothetical protein